MTQLTVAKPSWKKVIDSDKRKKKSLYKSLQNAYQIIKSINKHRVQKFATLSPFVTQWYKTIKKDLIFHETYGILQHSIILLKIGTLKFFKRIVFKIWWW